MDTIQTLAKPISHISNEGRRATDGKRRLIIIKKKNQNATVSFYSLHKKQLRKLQSINIPNYEREVS